MEKRIACSFLLIALFFGSSALAQKNKKIMWISYDPTDSLSVKVKDSNFFFFIDAKTSYSSLHQFERTDSKKSLDTLISLPKKVKLVSRLELIEILANIPNSITTSDGRDIDLFDSWYDRVYKKTYIVEKKEGYYLVYKVRMVYAIY